MDVLSKHAGPIRSGLALLALAAAGLALSSAALAQNHRATGSPHWRGDISRFHQHDWNTWRGGHWTHARHGGRLGWWWVAGGLWYFYPAPIYPYPSPWEPPSVALAAPATAVPAMAPAQYWYYCAASRNYYPYVASCPGGWQQVPATPVPQQ